MDVAQLVTVLTQLGLATAAWRLASALKVRVDNHETRLVVLEKAAA
jgi:hypothetical protein